jgi:carbohydrate-binding DOMON domain-containing protein
MNLRRRTAYLSILVAMLLMGFVIGYLYTSSNLGTTITTYTYTVTVFNTATITKTEIHTHTQTTTETQTTTVTAVETMTLKPRVILEYPSNPGALQTLMMMVLQRFL